MDVFSVVVASVAMDPDDAHGDEVVIVISGIDVDWFDVCLCAVFEDEVWDLTWSSLLWVAPSISELLTRLQERTSSTVTLTHSSILSIGLCLTARKAPALSMSRAEQVRASSKSPTYNIPPLLYSSTTVFLRFSKYMNPCHAFSSHLSRPFNMNHRFSEYAQVETQIGPDHLIGDDLVHFS